MDEEDIEALVESDEDRKNTILIFDDFTEADFEAIRKMTLSLVNGGAYDRDIVKCAVFAYLIFAKEIQQDCKNSLIC